MSYWTGRITVGGKLMLAGEYSVLSPSGMAVAVAVSPGLSVHVSDSEEWGLEREDLGIRWQLSDGPPPAPLLFAATGVLAVLKRFEQSACRPGTIRFEPVTAYGSGNEKPGVGGSASATVAAMAGVYQRLGKSINTEEFINLAITVHREAQGGRGSGYDVATISHGGLVEYQPRSLDAGKPVDVRSRRIPWPKGLQLIAGYTGHSASTTKLLQRLEACQEADATGTARAMSLLGQPVPALVDALRSGRFEQIVAAVSRCQHALESFDAALGIGIMTPQVSDMLVQATSVGAACKVSGAGGGDSVVALVPDEAVRRAVEAVWNNAGFRVLPVELSFDSPFGAAQ